MGKSIEDGAGKYWNDMDEEAAHYYEPNVDYLSIEGQVPPQFQQSGSFGLTQEDLEFQRQVRFSEKLSIMEALLNTNPEFSFTNRIVDLISVVNEIHRQLSQ